LHPVSIIFMAAAQPGQGDITARQISEQEIGQRFPTGMSNFGNSQPGSAIPGNRST
jgi:hypothetical protein